MPCSHSFTISSPDVIHSEVFKQASSTKNQSIAHKEGNKSEIDKEEVANSLLFLSQSVASPMNITDSQTTQLKTEGSNHSLVKKTGSNSEGLITNTTAKSSNGTSNPVGAPHRVPMVEKMDDTPILEEGSICTPVSEIVNDNGSLKVKPAMESSPIKPNQTEAGKGEEAKEGSLRRLLKVKKLILKVKPRGALAGKKQKMRNTKSGNKKLQDNLLAKHLEAKSVSVQTSTAKQCTTPGATMTKVNSPASLATEVDRRERLVVRIPVSLLGKRHTLSDESSNTNIVPQGGKRKRRKKVKRKKSNEASKDTVRV